MRRRTGAHRHHERDREVLQQLSELRQRFIAGQDILAIDRHVWQGCKKSAAAFFLHVGICGGPMKQPSKPGATKRDPRTGSIKEGGLPKDSKTARAGDNRRAGDVDGNRAVGPKTRRS